MDKEKITLEDIEKILEELESKECNNQNNLFMEGYRYCFNSFFRLIQQLNNKNKQLKNIIDKAQEFIRDENSLSESDIDYLSELLDSYR